MLAGNPSALPQPAETNSDHLLVNSATWTGTGMMENKFNMGRIHTQHHCRLAQKKYCQTKSGKNVEHFHHYSESLLIFVEKKYIKENTLKFYSYSFSISTVYTIVNLHPYFSTRGWSVIMVTEPISSKLKPKQKKSVLSEWFSLLYTVMQQPCIT